MIASYGQNASVSVDACAYMFAEFGRTAAKRAPLYARLSAGIAGDDELAGLLLTAPVTQRQPVLLFACVHALLLDGPDDPLARHYPNLTPDPDPGDPLPAFRAFCRSHRGALEHLLRTRSTQTNEIGRCALLLPAFGLVAAEVGAVTHLDVGTSAGLNLLLPSYCYRYEPQGTDGEVCTVGDASPVILTCGTRGKVPIPGTMPEVVRSRGLDRTPIDARDVLAPTSRRDKIRKFCAPPGRWKPTRSAPRSPSMISVRHGICMNSSTGGNGMCRKKPVVRSGRSIRSILGTSWS